jgi:hydrogenase/urease accessory protein HupE
MRAARRWHLAAAALTMIVAATIDIGAHEIGTTRVAVLLHDGRYTVDVITDGAALVEKLESVAGKPSSGVVTTQHVRESLAQFEDTFRTRLQLRFDGVDTRPDLSYSVQPPTDAASSPIATIRLSGAIPAGARAFTWIYAWTFASYAMTVRRDTSAIVSTVWLEGGDASAPIDLTAARPPTDRVMTAWRYLVLGFTHIVPYGFDHVLFVVGVFLLARRPRTVLWQVSAFTVAHSITLGASMLGVVTAPRELVEPLIAVSIAYVAIENVFRRELRASRVVVVFGFGLLHGLGFAGVLTELGLPPGEFVTALLAFNVGVEAGQMTVIGAAFLLVGWHCARHDWYRSRIVVPASLLIACTALYWTIERL